MSPLWPLFPLTPLTLLTLLAAAGGARADSAPAAAPSNNSSSFNESEVVLGGARAGSAPAAARGGGARSCGRHQPRPTIAATTATATSRRDEYYSSTTYNTYIYSTYANEITIFCSSMDASSLTIRTYDHQLQAERLNSTTIQVTLINPDVGHYSYRCTDSVTTCTDGLLVDVLPAMAVTAPHIFHTQNDNYFVTRGESYNVYCSGQPTTYFTFYEVHGHIIAVNATTLMLTVSDHTEGEREYFCGIYLNKFLYNSVRITVGDLEARDFRCVLIRLGLKCWWKSMSRQNKFKLFMLNESSLICIDNTGDITAGCAGTVRPSYKYYNNDLILQTCHTIYCRNQTYSINVRSITKLDPVDLKVVKTSPQGATVAWPNLYMYSSCTYKVEYRLLGTHWRSVNVSTCLCDYHKRACELQLALPCPDAHYELRVYARYPQATLDMYWSEPATLFFYTAPSAGGAVDPACAADFREVTQEPPPSATLLLYDVRQLISDERKEERALKKYITGLKKKLAVVKALMNAQK